MKKNNLIISIFGIVLFVFLSVSCGRGVTVTDNPEAASATPGGDIFSNELYDTTTQGDDDSAGESTGTETQDVLMALCLRLSFCYDRAALTTCLATLDTDENMLAEFGVNTSTYASFSEVQDAIDEGEILVSQDSVALCADALDDVSCTSMDTAGAYDENASTDYSNVYLIIPDEC